MMSFENVSGEGVCECHDIVTWICAGFIRFGLAFGNQQNETSPYHMLSNCEKTTAIINLHVRCQNPSSRNLSPCACALLDPSQNGIHFGNVAILQLLQLRGII